MPYGWRLSADGVHLEVDVAEQRILAVARRHRDRGLSLRAIGARLAAVGIVMRGGGRWHPQTVANALRGQLAA